MNLMANTDPMAVFNRALEETRRAIAAPSALAPTESAGKLGAFPLAGGSLPAASVQWLLKKWQAHADDTNWNAHYRIAWQNCIDDLRAELEAANLRQPEENGRDEPRAGSAATPKQ